MPTEFEKKWLILCEGAEDQAFLKEFLKAHEVDGFQVEYSKGWQKFGLTLSNYKEVQSFIDTVEVVVVMTDCDEGKETQFKNVCKKIENDSQFNVPTAPLVKSVAKAGHPSLVVIMIPMDQDKGGLEGFILKAAYSKFKVKRRLERFIQEMPAKNWKQNPQDKARIRA